MIVGRDGQPDAAATSPGVGKPAAWISADGTSWTAAQVEGAAVAGGELRQVALDRAGLFAEGVEGPASGTGGRVLANGWVSRDGHAWRSIGRLGTAVEASTVLASTGSQMVILGGQPPPTGLSPLPLAAWSSTDGTTWIRLRFSFKDPSQTALPGVEDPGAEAQTAGGVLLSDAFVVRDGLVLLVSKSVPPGVGNAFAAAVEP